MRPNSPETTLLKTTNSTAPATKAVMIWPILCHSLMVLLEDHVTADKPSSRSTTHSPRGLGARRPKNTCFHQTPRQGRLSYSDGFGASLAL
jgi:hypothetical protein